MIDSPLLETLRKFTNSELKQLERFVQSPFFFHEDNASGVVALFNDVYRFMPHFQSPELDKQLVAKRLNQTPQYVAKLASGLHNVVRKFIAYIFSDEYKDDFYEQLSLLKFYQERQLNQRFDNLNQRIKADLNKIAHLHNENFYKKQWLFNTENVYFQEKHNVSGGHNYHASIKSLDAFYLLFKIRSIYKLLVRQHSFSINNEESYAYLTIIEEIDSFAKTNALKDYPLIQLFYKAILILERDKRGHFGEFQYQLAQYSRILDKDDYSLFHGLSRQQLLLKYNQGDVSVLNELFTTYQHHLYKGLLTSNGYLQPMTFSNIVKNGCRLGKFKWIERFLVIFKNKIGGTANVKELYRLYYAYFLLYSGRSKEITDDYLTNYEDIIFRIDARRIDLMASYENNDDTLDYKIESFRKLVRNTQNLPETHRTWNHNFALVLRKMLNPDLKRNNKRIEKLTEDIRSQATSEAAWLIAKLEKLKRKTY